MRENVGDALLGKMLKRKEAVSSLIAKQYRSKPFASVPVSKEEQLWAVDNLGFEDMNDLVNEFGRDKVNYMLYNTEKLRG